MSDDEKSIYEHMLAQYRQDADVLKFNLARANAQLAAKDRIITDLREIIERPKPPKPGPPPAR